MKYRVKETDIFLFDVDNTLYPKHSGLFNEVDKRINLFLQKYLDIPLNKVNLLRKKYLYEYGTTLNGLMKNHGVEPIFYLEFVHDVPVENFILENIKLKNFLNKNKNKKIIFSNAYKKYIEKILNLLDIADYFDEIFDIVLLDYNPKPNFKPYKTIMQKFNLKGNNFIMIDDSANNLLTAKKCQMTTIYINNNSLTNNNFSFNIKKIEDLEKIIDF